MKVTILGCGASSGSPLMGEEMPANPKNFRSRTSIFIEGENTNILIDTSPDLRYQALAAKIKRVDAILYTHTHADHIHGIDDAKSYAYRQKKPVDVYSNQQSIDELKSRFAYCFDETPSHSGWMRPYLKPHVIEYGQTFQIGEFGITAFRQEHAKDMDSIGYRIGNFVYSTDVKLFPSDTDQYLSNMDVWVVDCLRSDPSPTHSDITQTLGWIKKYRPKHAVLTHLSYQLDYDELNAKLPPEIEPAFDGMVIEL